MSGAVLLLFAVASFGWLYPEVMYPRYGGLQSRITEGWDPFSLARLQKTAVREGRTVIVDFSADWCFNCKVLEKTQLHTDVVNKAITDASAIKLYADFTDYPAEIKDTISALKSNGVPVIAIFPGDKPYEPIVFRDGYTASKIAAALRTARSGQGTAGMEPTSAAEVAASIR
jgi:thiol:disulfide interchange protein